MRLGRIKMEKNSLKVYFIALPPRLPDFPCEAAARNSRELNLIKSHQKGRMSLPTKGGARLLPWAYKEPLHSSILGSLISCLKLQRKTPAT